MALEAPSNRRELERFPVTRSIALTTSLAISSLDATILDFNERGLRVFTPGLLYKGERIVVHWGQREVVGQVVHCWYEQSGTTAGIRLVAAQ